ncbi:hypothetical protein [Hugenholtzia roseola]|uniref:hypothetical protein n=1 Tax=Hugenholtzia roseola TaxID=1002 RepID=UPI0004203FD7|nr:hypothetical protein [Hugenholtzia roseola]
MKTINLSDEDFEKLTRLLSEHDELYGDENETVWSFDDVENLRQIGTEFISILSPYLKQIQENA